MDETNDAPPHLFFLSFLLTETSLAEITFKTDPKGMDYTCERGAKRNFEVWRKADDNDDDAHKLETDEERLDRLEAEEAERGVMEVLEGKVVDAKREMEIADALDEIRTRNARIQRAEGKGEVVDQALEQAERARVQKEAEERRVRDEDEEAARRAFGRGIEIDDEEVGDEGTGMAGDGVLADGGVVGEVAAAKGATVGVMPPPEFKRVVKKKKDFSAALGIKKKPALV